jgi:hypothetical protein
MMIITVLKTKYDPYILMYVQRRRFTYRLHGAISQKMATFITTSVRSTNPSEC